MAREEAWLDSFIFQQRHGRLNVRALSRLDLAEVIEHVEVEKLHDMLENLAFCNLKKTDLPSLSDEMIIKAFRVSQLIIEYLLNRQNHLDVRIEGLVKESNVLAMDIETLVQDNNTLAEANDHLKRDLKSRKKQLATLEVVLTSKGGCQGLASAYVCKTCGKAFHEERYLAKHCARRNHAGFDDLQGRKENDALLGNNDQLVASFKQVVKEELRGELESSYAKAHEIHAETLQEVRKGFEASMQRQLEDQRSRYESTITRLQARVETLEAIRKEDAESAREKLGRVEEDNRRLVSEMKAERSKDRGGVVKPAVDVVDVAVEAIGCFERIVPVSDACVQAEVEERPMLSGDSERDKYRDVVNVEDDITEKAQSTTPAEPEPARKSVETAAIAMQTVEEAEEKSPVVIDVSEVVREYLAALDHNEITASVLRKMNELEVEVSKEISETDVKTQKQAKLFCPVESGLVKCRWNHKSKAVKERAVLVAKKLEGLASSIAITEEVIERLIASEELDKLDANLKATLDSVVGRDKPKAARKAKVAQIERELEHAEMPINVHARESFTNTDRDKRGDLDEVAKERSREVASTKGSLEDDSDSVDSSLSSSFDVQPEMDTQNAENNAIASDTSVRNDDIEQGSEEELKESSLLEQFALGSDGSALSSISHSGFIPRYEEDSSVANSFQRNVTNAEILEEVVQPIDEQHGSVDPGLPSTTREQGSSIIRLKADKAQPARESVEPLPQNQLEAEQQQTVVSSIQSLKSKTSVRKSEGDTPHPIQLSTLEGGSSVEQKSQDDEESPLPDPPLPEIANCSEGSAPMSSSSVESDHSATSATNISQLAATTSRAEAEAIGLEIRRVDKATFADMEWAARVNVEHADTVQVTDQSSGNMESESGSFLVESDLSGSSQEELLAHE